MRHGRPVLALHVDGEPPAPWQEAFEAALPAWEVVSGPVAAETAERVAVAVVWAPPPGYLGAFPRLALVVSVGAGLDHLASDPSRPAAAAVLRREEPEGARSMAEFVLMQVLLHHRGVGLNILDRHHRGWEPLTRGPLAGCRISVLGFGPMARATADLLAAFGCSVTAWSRSPRAHGTVTVLSGWDRFDALFPDFDLVINLLPSAPETRGLIDARRLALMRPGAGFINVGRGDAVVQSALLAALDAGHLALASLDVLPTEPPAPDDPVWTHPRVILTPHVASLPLPTAFAAWVAGRLVEEGRATPNLPQQEHAAG